MSRSTNTRGIVSTAGGEHEPGTSSKHHDAPPLPARYRDEGRLAGGSFGEVRRVFDTFLGRHVAMKILRPDVAKQAHHAVRFMNEVKLTAGLTHPGIVAVHDWGILEDGRAWYTMREVRGRTLTEVIEEVYDPERQQASEWTFRRMIDAFSRVCQAVAYAHRRGVLHRDLKPDNIMVGELGDMLVMDWGLGRKNYEPPMPAESSEDSPRSEDSSLTRHGDVLGTPAYMPPEQALGRHDLHGPPSDVYALGAVLYHLLTGKPPYRGTSSSVLAQVIAEPPRPVSEVAPHPIPQELVRICERAMHRSIEGRHPNAEVLADDVVAWLDGARRREQALEAVERARLLEPEIAEKKALASSLRVKSVALMEAVRPFDPVEKKLPGWTLEEEADLIDVKVALLEATWLETLQGALAFDPDLPEAHAALAEHYCRQLREAERARREADAARAETLLRAHDHGRYASLLRGEGTLSLRTEPPGAEVWLEEYVSHGRRLVAKEVGLLGVTPLQAVPLKKGSYRLRLRAPGCIEVIYPIKIERGEHEDCRAPGEPEPPPVVLPREGTVGPGERYVAAGWGWFGGTTDAAESLPLRRLWVDAFVIQSVPVTNEAYLEFLNDLLLQGREAEALAACPQPHPGMPHTPGELSYGRDPQGKFFLKEVAGDASGRPWRMDWPVVLIDWYGACAYARWLAARTGHPWRLPDEIEREKAARGADARWFPWGYHFDATWACVLDSHPGDPTRVGVHEFHHDESPYGVRGLAGNVRDWCANLWTQHGPPTQNDRLILTTTAAEDPEHRAIRGGAWTSRPELSRSEARFASRPSMRWTTTGLRLVRSLTSAKP